MDGRVVGALLAGVVALSLVGAPVTMADWGEQASFSVERIEQSQIRDETPVLDFEDLSPAGRNAVRRAIESPDGTHTVYGREDRPEDFFYSDYSAPGQGLYAIAYEDTYYRLTTYAAGGFPFVYWLMEIPFIAYGIVLSLVAFRTARGPYSPRLAGLATLPGVAFHLLGPEFDFPILAPTQFVGLGLVATLGLLLGLVWLAYRPSIPRR